MKTHIHIKTLLSMFTYANSNPSSECHIQPTKQQPQCYLTENAFSFSPCAQRQYIAITYEIPIFQSPTSYIPENTPHLQHTQSTYTQDYTETAITVIKILAALFIIKLMQSVTQELVKENTHRIDMIKKQKDK